MMAFGARFRVELLTIVNVKSFDAFSLIDAQIGL